MTGTSAGGIGLSVTGQGNLAALLAAELGDGIGDPQDAVLQVDISSTPLVRPAGMRLVGGSRVPFRHEVGSNGQEVWIELSTLAGQRIFQVLLDGHPYTQDQVRAQLWIPLARPLVDYGSRFLVRPGSKDYATITSLAAKNVTYDIIDPIWWCMLLRQRATLVHSSAVQTPGGQGLLLLGSGGVGKSTSVLELVSRHGCRYVGDDLVLLSGDGTLARHPKHLQVYGYNLELVPSVTEGLLGGRSAGDRFAWWLRRRLLGPKRVRRRVAAAELFGPEAVTDDVRLGRAFVLNATSGDLAVKPTDAVVEARRAASTIVDELWEFAQYLNAVSMIDDAAPTLAQLADATCEVVHSALADVEVLAVDVPRGTAGVDLAEVVLNASIGQGDEDT